MTFNPYAAPTGPAWGNAPFEPYGAPPASLGARFAAKMLDGLLDVAALVPAFVAFFVAINNMADSPAVIDAFRKIDVRDTVEVAIFLFKVFALPFGLAIGCTLALAIYQWYLIACDGQTLGKKWMGIRIVKQTDEPAGFVSGVLVRQWLPALVVNVIPYFGGCLGLIDVLFIFGADRQCLHDKIAGTKVISVR